MNRFASKISKILVPEKTKEENATVYKSIMSEWLFYLIFLIITIGLFSTLWGVAGLSETFSERLSESEIVRIWYVSWYTFYTTLNISLLIPTFLDYYHNKTILYLIFTILYVLFTLMKLIGLLLIFIFDVNTHNTAHDISAGLAFGGAWVASFCLLIRRYLEFKNKYILLFLNTMWVIAGLIILIFLYIERTGPLEFTFTLYIILDRVWQVVEHYYIKFIIKIRIDHADYKNSIMKEMRAKLINPVGRIEKKEKEEKYLKSPELLYRIDTKPKIIKKDNISTNKNYNDNLISIAKNYKE